MENYFVLICFFVWEPCLFFITWVWVLYSLTFCVLYPFSREPSSFYMGSYQPLWFQNKLYFITSILMIIRVPILPAILVVEVVLHNLIAPLAKTRSSKDTWCLSYKFTWSSPIEEWFLIRNDCRSLGRKQE